MALHAAQAITHSRASGGGGRRHCHSQLRPTRALYTRHVTTARTHACAQPPSRLSSQSAPAWRVRAQAGSAGNQLQKSAPAPAHTALQLLTISGVQPTPLPTRPTQSAPGHRPQAQQPACTAYRPPDPPGWGSPAESPGSRDLGQLPASLPPPPLPGLLVRAQVHARPVSAPGGPTKTRPRPEHTQYSSHPPPQKAARPCCG